MAVGDRLRRRVREEVERLSPEERVALSFRLGEEDLQLFRAASGLDRQAALQRLAAQRQVGRQPSRAAQVKARS